MGVLFATVLKEAGAAAPDAGWLKLTTAMNLTRRLEAMALYLLDRHPDLLPHLSKHPSDTVRIWAALMVGLGKRRPLAKRLKQLMPFAADAHAGLARY